MLCYLLVKKAPFDIINFDYFDLFYFSDEDINVKGLVSAWLKKQNESTVRFLVQLIDDYFYKGKAMYLQKVGHRCMFNGYFLILLIPYHIMCWYTKHLFAGEHFYQL